MTVLVLTPIEQEFNALARFLQKQDGGSEENLTLGRLPLRRFSRLDLLLACGGLGKAQFGIQAQHLIDFCPSALALVCAGAAGRLGDGLHVGDVVVATETVEHDPVYRFAPRKPPRFPADPGLLARLRAAADQAPFKVHFGPVASGDEDVVDRKRADDIRKRTGALAVAWEGAGGARACQFSQVPFIEIRGVSDGANPLALISFVFSLGAIMERIGWLVLQLGKAD
jgi:adenosylhomocysteine nucleosidase